MALLVCVALAVPVVGWAGSVLTNPIGFSGTGGKTLPTFRVVRPSTLFWHSSGGGEFELSSSLSNGDLGSSRASGWTYLAPGRYQYTVNASGRWRFRVVPGVVHPRRLAGGFLSYSGNGSMELPPIRIGHAGTLTWAEPSAGIFQLASNTTGGVTSQQKSKGSVHLVKGTYTYVVNADGPWTITWKP